MSHIWRARLIVSFAIVLVFLALSLAGHVVVLGERYRSPAAAAAGSASYIFQGAVYECFGAHWETTPIPDVAIYLRGDNDGDPNTGSDLLDTTHTDGNGRFSLDHDPALHS